MKTSFRDNPPTHHIEHKADESMVRSEWQQYAVNQHYVLEVVDDTFPIEKVHGGTQKVPVQSLGKSQRPGSARDVGNGNDLFEGNDLDGGDNDDYVDVSSEHGAEEDSNHGKRPYGTGDEGLLLLLILGDVCLGLTGLS